MQLTEVILSVSLGASLEDALGEFWAAEDAIASGNVLLPPTAQSDIPPDIAEFIDSH